MSGCSQLPLCLQALAVPILDVTVAAFGVCIATGQMLIAHDKLQHDVFEKRRCPGPPAEARRRAGARLR
jgi:hypothetical protein